MKDTSLICLGADPEIVFIGEKGILSARDVCGLPRQNRDGNDPELGADGHPHIAEMRPKPARTPEELTENIRGILARNYKKIPEYAIWKAGSWVAEKPIGGHIHFSGISQDQSLVEALDGVLTQTVLLLEDPMEARKRRAGDYGKLSDVRGKSWGFEYRTLPSFILSPPITLGVFALAKAIAYEHMLGERRCINKLKDSELAPLIRIDPIKFINADRAYFTQRMDLFWDTVVRNYMYWNTDEGKPLWKNVALLKHIAKNHPNWHNGKDLLERWGIRKPTKELKKEFYWEKGMGVLLDAPMPPAQAFQRVFRNLRQLM